jgi:putative oxidoreductase
MLDKFAQFAPRAAMAAIFLWSGTGKIVAFQATADYVASAGLPAPMLATLGAILVELGAGTALLAGRRIAVSAGALAIFTLAAAALFHNPFGGEDALIHFLKNVAIAGGLAQIALSQDDGESVPRTDAVAS